MISKELEEKITNAQERIESLYFQTKGQCYLSFSGGKDSTVVLALIKQCEELLTIPKNSIPAVFSDTGIELGATREFVHWCKTNYYDNIVIMRPTVTFDWIIKNKGKPIKSKMKSQYLYRYQHNKHGTALNYLLGNENYQKTKIANKDLHMIHDDFDIKAADACCEYLKKKPFANYEKEHETKGYLTGIRNSEGGARELATVKRLQTGGKLCTAYKKDKIVKMPIIDWTDQDIEDFIKEYKVPLSKAYTTYNLERTGCFLCPFSLRLQQNLKVLYEFENNRYRDAMYWLKDVYIAQNVVLEFDEAYEKERKDKWINDYQRMRYEMLLKYRPCAAKDFDCIQLTLF